SRPTVGGSVGFGVRAFGTLLDDDQHGADLGLLALLDVDALDDAGRTGRHLDDRLVGLEFDKRLVLVDPVTLFDQHANNGAGLDALPYVGKFYFGRHETSLSIRTVSAFMLEPQSRYGSAFSGSIPSASRASRTTFASSRPSCASACRVASTMC